MSFDSLPEESIVHILLFLSPKEIRKCQQVCRLLVNLIKDSPHLLYLLELDSLGYSAPLNPRTDLSYDEKIKILLRMRNPPDQSANMRSYIDLGTAPVSIPNCQFSGGIFAQSGPHHMFRSLHLYQLSSYNKNTSYEHWQLSDLGVDAHDFKMDPDLDLLILLASGGPEIDHVQRFHLRSLRTGLPHPLAAMSSIICIDKFTASRLMPYSFQIVGRFVALLSVPTHHLISDSPRISVWDWTTGDFVTFADVSGRSFAFISNTCFVVECDRRKWAKEVIGSLEVYTFNPSGLAQRARHAASLHLPTTPEGPCHSSFRFVFAPFGPLSFANGFPPSTLLPRTYDLSPSSHYVCLKISVSNIHKHRSETARGTLFIPATAILDAISAISSRESQVHVPWEHWAHGASWVNGRGTRGESDIFGQRAGFVRYNPDLLAWQILVYELGPSIRVIIEDPMAPSLSKPSGAELYIDRVFMGGRCGARNPAMVWLITVPETGDALWVNNPPKVVMDDEHVLTYKLGSQTIVHTLHTLNL